MSPRRKPENYVTKTCPVCGKEFTRHVSQPRTTCSLACRSQYFSPDAKITAPCPECGKEFTYYKSHKGVRKYCSHTCAGKHRQTNIKRWKPSAYTATCEQCGKEYTTTPKATRGRFCSRPCWYKWLKEHAPTGPDSPNFGRNFPRPSHLPPPLTKKCQVCGKEFATKASQFQQRVTCSKSCYAILQVTQEAGANNFNWKGGYLPYYGPNWRAQRRKVRERDGYTCQRCGISEHELGRELDVHHIRRFGDFKNYKLANQESNLISLCPICHLVVEPRKGK